MRHNKENEGSTKPKVIIIGGGVSGLSAGIYAQKCGFDVTIVESHRIAGGNCASWKRNGYQFEGGLHWLGGSKAGTPLNRAWRHVGALDDGVVIHTDEPFVEYRHETGTICLYRDTAKTEQHLLALAPQDSRIIRSFCRGIKTMSLLPTTLTDIKGVKVTGKKETESLGDLIKTLRALRVLLKYSKIVREDYAKRFTHPGLSEFIQAIPGEQQGIGMLMMTMGSLAGGDGGFPEGGSVPFVQRMVRTFEACGGTLLLSTRALKVVVKQGKAVGVEVRGKGGITGKPVQTDCVRAGMESADAKPGPAGESNADAETRLASANNTSAEASLLKADAVIVASDTMKADALFSEPLQSVWLAKIRAITSPTSAVLVSLGINCDLSRHAKGFIMRFPQPLRYADKQVEYVLVSNYAGDQNYAPAGKTVLTMQLPGDTYDFWVQARAEGRYVAEKRNIQEQVERALTEQIPEIAGCIEVCDIATPLTYERYCDNWRGSWMTEITSALEARPYPPTVDNISALYFCGHRMMPPGGYPPAILSARTAVQHLCKDTGTVFVSEEGHS